MHLSYLEIVEEGVFLYVYSGGLKGPFLVMNFGAVEFSADALAVEAIPLGGP